MGHYRPELDTCPFCSSKGNCHIHAYYRRKIGAYKDGVVVWEKVTVMRVRCSSCGHTHAVLPDVIIPYNRYGLLFILKVLASHFSGQLCAEKICERFSISRNTFFKWLSLWHKHKDLFLGRLASSQTGSHSFMAQITEQQEYSAFASSFVRSFAVSFLQSHKNPANYCQQVFDP